MKIEIGGIFKDINGVHHLVTEIEGHVVDTFNNKHFIGDISFDSTLIDSNVLRVLKNKYIVCTCAFCNSGEIQECLIYKEIKKERVEIGK